MVWTLVNGACAQRHKFLSGDKVRKSDGFSLGMEATGGPTLQSSQFQSVCISCVPTFEAPLHCSVSNTSIKLHAPQISLMHACHRAEAACSSILRQVPSSLPKLTPPHKLQVDLMPSGALRNDEAPFPVEQSKAGSTGWQLRTRRPQAWRWGLLRDLPPSSRTRRVA